MKDFVDCFGSANELMLGPIYPASEEPIEGITSDNLSLDINLSTSNMSQSVNSLENIFLILEKRAIEDNEEIVVIALGAGSIGRKVREWVQQLN